MAERQSIASVAGGLIIPHAKRQWMWADRMKNEFLSEIDGPIPYDLDSSFWMYRSLWLSLLYSVLEALREAEIRIASIQELIDVNYEGLRIFRNHVVHVQPHQPGLIKSDHDDLVQLHDAVGEFLVEN